MTKSILKYLYQNVLTKDMGEWFVGRIPEIEAGKEGRSKRMGMFLNSAIPLEAYKTIAASAYFVDKTMLLDELLNSLRANPQQYICITRPRRFGKTVAANMLAAFLTCASDSRQIFGELAIANTANFSKHLNQHKVVFIDGSRSPRDCTCYETYIDRIQNGINQDLAAAYPELKIDIQDTVWDVLGKIFEKTGHKFVFIIDEWDAVFHMPFVSEGQQKEYLRFLKNLLKDQVYVEFAYLTGILPITKYSGGSELNMFQEYNMATSEKYGEYFGFLETEVDELFCLYEKTVKRPRISREDLQLWYDGYYTAAGERLYNPRSVICALTDNQLRNYWTNSGPYDEIFYYIRNNIDDVREDLILMVSGERVGARMQEYAATASQLNTKDQIYSAMVVYGLLTYDERSGQVFIPNKELMAQFNELLLSKESLGYIHNLAKESARMLKATLAGDTATMAEILKFAHDTEAPIFSYNNEIELSAVVNLVYLAARDRYRVEREDKAGEGYVDFIFYPERKTDDALILELKAGDTPQAAVCQIRRKNYALRFRGKLGERPKYSGRILAVGIGYDKKTKEHSCVVEAL